jgi:hypothetical protein
MQIEDSMRGRKSNLSCAFFLVSVNKMATVPESQAHDDDDSFSLRPNKKQKTLIARQVSYTTLLYPLFSCYIAEIDSMNRGM